MTSRPDLTRNPEVTELNIISRLERLPYTSWQTMIRVIVGVALFFDAMDYMSIAYVLPVVSRTWHIGPQKVGWLISVGFIGGALGAICCGWLAEKFGRMRIMVFTIALYSVMSFLCCFSWDYTSLLIFRSIQGFGLGGEVPTAAAYINEWSKTQHRGRFFLLYSMIFTFGTLGGALLGVWIVPAFGWRYMFLIGAIPAALAAVFRYFVPESPRWLASKGRLLEADRVLSKVENRISKGGKVPLPPVTPLAVAPVTGETRWTELFRGIYLRRTFILWMLAFSTAFLNLGLASWLPTIYRTVFKLPLQVALMYGMLTQAAAVVSNLFAAYLVDWTGKRVWFSMSLILGSIPFFWLWSSRPGDAETLLVLVLINNIFIASSLLLTTLYMVEIYPTRMRALGSSVSRIWNSLATICSPIVIGSIMQAYGFYPVFIVFGVVAAVSGVLAAGFVVETKGRVLEELSP